MENEVKVKIGAEFLCNGGCGKLLIRKTSNHEYCPECVYERKKKFSAERKRAGRLLKSTQTIKKQEQKEPEKPTTPEVIPTSITYKISESKVSEEDLNDRNNYCFKFGGYFSLTNELGMMKVRMLKTTFRKMCKASYESTLPTASKSEQVSRNNNSFMCVGCKLGERVNKNKEDIYPINVDWIDESTIQIIEKNDE